MRPYLLLLLFKRIGAIRHLMTDSTVPFRQKALVVFGVVYLISPIDLIPLPVLGFGILDDLVLWGFILSYLKERLDKYSTPKDGDKKYRGKKIIDEVEYEIKEDEKEDRKDDENE